MSNLRNLIVRDVAELPDRSSPPESPDMMLVSAAELDLILSRRLAWLVSAAENAKDFIASFVDDEFEGGIDDLHSNLVNAIRDAGGNA